MRRTQGLAASVGLALALLITQAGRVGPSVEADRSEAESAVAGSQEGRWPARVLITNDDGIDDVGILALARAFAEVAETYVVAPAADRSGSSNYMSALTTDRFRVERRDLGDERITAYALDGYPADCVLFAISGPLRDAPPDLVVSGINGGANLGDSWFLSGTVGAARTAAFLGVAAIAVSGVDKEDPEALRAVADWVVRLAASPAVRGLEPRAYLTISLPAVAPDRISGIEVVGRARGVSAVSRRSPTSGDGAEVWELDLSGSGGEPAPDSDASALARGHIAVVAMRVDEEDRPLSARLRGTAGLAPW